MFLQFFSTQRRVVLRRSDVLLFDEVSLRLYDSVRNAKEPQTSIGKAAK